MKKHIGIFIDSKKTSGGAYQELLYIIKNFEKIHHKFEISIIFSNKNLEIDTDKFKFKVLFLKMNSFNRFFSSLVKFNKFFRKIKNYLPIKNQFEKLIKKNKIDLIYFTGPSQYSLYLENTNFLITVPDVSHRENIEFPEMISNFEFERREEILKNALPKAIAILTNARIIKDRITFLYKVLPNRIIILNHQPSLAVSSFNFSDQENKSFLIKYNLKKNYLFYPAMYFPHKNHKTLIDALEKLKLKGLNFNLVCCGKDHGYLSEIRSYVEKKKLAAHINFLDYVEDEELPYLYLNSSMLVMTSLIGPTNIPPWEAFKLKIPVIYPRLEGIEEVYEDCVLYFEPLDSDDLARKIKKIFSDARSRDELILKGIKKIEKITNDNEFYNVIRLINAFFEKKL